ncbi:hypothetical protein [Kitasatospora sp. NPDC059327]|uniref:hypothetical protein n=1 Tax=Kitasatospora sp. NPDC059327 TaxID=3346803 RepID=UPI0036ACD161
MASREGTVTVGQTVRMAGRCDTCGGPSVRQVSRFVLERRLWWDAETAVPVAVRDGHG